MDSMGFGFMFPFESFRVFMLNPCESLNPKTSFKVGFSFVEETISCFFLIRHVFHLILQTHHGPTSYQRWSAHRMDEHSCVDFFHGRNPCLQPFWIIGVHTAMQRHPSHILLRLWQVYRAYSTSQEREINFHLFFGKPPKLPHTEQFWKKEIPMVVFKKSGCWIARTPTLLDPFINNYPVI